MGGRSAPTSASASPSRLETERRFRIGARAAAFLRRLRRAGPYRIVPARTRRLRSVYLDTEDRLFARRGIGVRVRRDGRSWELTLKRDEQVEGDLHVRTEHTLALDGPLVFPGPLPAGAVPPRFGIPVRGLRVEPVLETDIRRWAAHVLDENGDVVAELAVDAVVAKRAGGGVIDRYRELEIEAKGTSTAEDLGAVVTAVREAAGGRVRLLPATESKLARGLRRLEGGPGAPRP